MLQSRLFEWLAKQGEVTKDSEKDKANSARAAPPPSPTDSPAAVMAWLATNNFDEKVLSLSVLAAAALTCSASSGAGGVRRIYRR